MQYVQGMKSERSGRASVEVLEEVSCDQDVRPVVAVFDVVQLKLCAVYSWTLRFHVYLALYHLTLA